MVEYIQAPPDEHWEAELLAVLIRRGYDAPGGTRFLTRPDQPLQLATLSYPKGHEVAAHEHAVAPREVRFTQEALVVRAGRLRADIYDRRRALVARRLLGPGDVLLLVGGGHGFLVVEDAQLVEVKGGPYVAGEKVRFEAKT